MADGFQCSCIQFPTPPPISHAYPLDVSATTFFAAIMPSVNILTVLSPIVLAGIHAAPHQRRGALDKVCTVYSLQLPTQGPIPSKTPHLHIHDGNHSYPSFSQIESGVVLRSAWSGARGAWVAFNTLLGNFLSKRAASGPILVGAKGFASSA